MEILGTALGIIAILLAIWHLAEIRSQAHELRTQADTLEQTRRSLSTRYVGEFPDYLPQIVDLIHSARKEVLIFCDFPAYGHFTDHSNWLRYSYEIAQKSLHQVRISLTHLTESGRAKFNREQFLRAEQAWDEWKIDQRVRDKLQNLLQSHKRNADIDALSKKEFLDLLEDTNKQALQTTFARVETQEVDGYMPLYFWLADRMEAIFAIPSFSGEHTEYGFSTSDPKLLSALIEMRERYYRRLTSDENPTKTA